MDRQEARNLMESKLANQNLRKHVLAVAAVMRRLAFHFGGDPNRFEIIGLLHDLDYEVTKDDPDRHALVTAGWLEELGVEPDIIHAVKAHADKAPRNRTMDKAVYCADPVTGFLVACALIHPDKSLDAIDVDFAMKRMKEKRFAAGADRGRIEACRDLGITTEKFMEIALEAMREIKGELGL